MIQRQARFLTGDKMLKGGLHCHTTRSDGEGAENNRYAWTNPIFL